MGEEKKKLLSQEDIMKLLDGCYDKCLNGVPYVSPTVEEFANDYLAKYPSKELACKAMIKNQIIKCTTSGFLTGFGGIVTLPVTLPANIGSVLYVQMRMIACLAYMGGFEVQSDQVQTLVYACLAGISIDQIVKNVGIQFGVKFTTAMVKKIPGTVLTKINQKVGFRFLTKFGSKGLINIGKAVPIIGGIIGGGFDLVETKIIADRAYKMFINGDMSVLSGENCGENDIPDDSDVLAEEISVTE